MNDKHQLVIEILLESAMQEMPLDERVDFLKLTIIKMAETVHAKPTIHELDEILREDIGPGDAKE